MKQRISDGLAALGLTPPSGAVEALAEYGRLLLEQNQVMNLTAITEPDQVVDLHFLDSAALLGTANFQGKTLIDVGTGAGFPGLPLRLLEPSLRVTLVDSLGKRIHWLEELCTALHVEDTTCLHARAEELSLNRAYRDPFDFATARAVAPLNLLDSAKTAIQHLGGRLLPVYDYTIPGAGITHRVVLVEKIAPTPKGYPRRWAKIQKTPL